MKSSDRITPAEILGNICELMCFCVQHHRFRIRYYVMRNNVVEKILRLTRRREKYLVVAAVRFLRTCIALKDEFYYRYIVKHNCFEPVIAAFLANGNRYNLLNSAVLELIDFIRRVSLFILCMACLQTSITLWLVFLHLIDSTVVSSNQVWIFLLIGGHQEPYCTFG
jgi:protein phosphatase-4 regulatory subunit 3